MSVHLGFAPGAVCGGTWITMGLGDVVFTLIVGVIAAIGVWHEKRTGLSHTGERGKRSCPVCGRRFRGGLNAGSTETGASDIVEPV